MISSIASSRCQDLILPRVKDLECSREWIGLTYDIDNLERMKSRAKWKNIQSENTSALLKSTCRQVTNRHSALELNEPSIVYVHMTTSEDLVHKLQETDNRSGSVKCVSPGEYTESYFNDNNSTDIDKVLRKDESRRSYQENVKDGDRCRIKNSASLENPRRSVLNTDSPSYRDKSRSVSSQRTDKTDILFYPGSDEFRGSKERLHEIFEHNRLLRRRFFNDMPGEPKDSHSRGISTCGQIGMIKSRLEIPKHNSGFGSTETLTSQSNQSGVSSTNGRKSRGDFENCSEFIFDQFNQIQEDNVSDRDTVGVTESNRFSVSRSINRSATESISEYNLPRFQPEQIPNYTDDQSASEHRKYLRDSGLPTIQTMDYKDCLGNVEEKFFATRARIKEFPETQVVVRRCNRPTPLDLKDRVNRTYSAIYESECKMIKNYTAEELTPALHGDEKTYINLMALGNDRKLSKNFNDRDNEFALKSSKSLGELSAKATQPITNKSCSDISTVEDLRSPQLVNSFSNSLIDLSMHELSTGQRSLQLSDDDLNADCGKSIDSSIPGTGTTLPLIYGPLPYKSPRRYVEGEVTIHYRSPVRTEAKEILSEEELARRSAENMRRVYQEERRRKYLQELHDIDSRRHTDNFIPSQKSPIPLNRYDDFVDDLSYRSRSQEQTPEPRLVARALYNFVGQTSRELSFRRGDIILIRRQIDKNWYEGEHNAMVGLFPLNHVEILPYDGARTTPKKPYEGQARAKFNFIAQTNLELSLAKGELVVLTRRVDENWYEGRIGNKKGIFPVSYVEVIMEPGQHRPETPVSSKPVASPAAHSMLSNGTASGKMSMGPHHYTPSIPVKTSTTEPQYISLPRIGVTERNKLHVAPVNETLHIDTHSDTIPYRALYNYRPQNEDELELKEGDTVYVIEKCDDGWFVGSSQRTGYFGTFPGNYVERL